MNERRVAVTGVGVISALGLNATEFRNGLFDGRSGIGPIQSLDTERLRFKNAAEIKGFDPKTHFDKRELMLLGRFAQLSIITAREATTDAGIDWSKGDLRERTAVVTGTGAGGLASMDDYYIAFYCDKKDRFPPTVVPKAMPNAGASNISMEFGISGPTFTVSTACSSANHAIGQAFHLVRSGAVDMAITGGSETPIGLSNLKTWDCMRVVANDTCRPFSKDRSGMILGEGGATLILENMELAKARGAHIYCEIKGFGMSADAGHITKPSEDGAARAIKAALADGNIAGTDVDYINAHGTGTGANDPMETRAIRRSFGAHADSIPVSSTKSMHGHTLGAAGAIEAVATVLAIKHGVVPPTANYREADPECDLDVVPNEARETNISIALSDSFAFGGLNAVVAFSAFD
jgi:nodulation protein E